jgi:FAD/FMN-containing dehydrogenase
MGRIYTVEFEATAVTAAVDFFEIDAAAEKPVEIVGLFLSQSSDVGDAADEMLRYRVIRGHTTSGSGGSAPTPRPVQVTDAAAGFAAETLNTTIASAGTGVNLHSDAFNIRTGLGLWLPEGCEWDTSGASLLVVRLMAAPTDSLTMSGTLYVREQG